MRDVPERIGGIPGGAGAWVVGGALRDELLGRPIVDIDIACNEPETTARAFARGRTGAPFPLSERHGAWRVVLEAGRTVDFTPLPRGIEHDLASRDFALNAMARPVTGGELLDPHGGRTDIEAGLICAVSPDVFVVDPVRLLRAVRLEDELGFRCDERTRQLVEKHAALAGRPAGERVLAELERLSAAGFRRLAELGLLAAVGGSDERLDLLDRFDSPEYRLVCALGDSMRRLPISRRLDRFASTLLGAAPLAEGSPRAVHRFRRATEPWSLEALAFTGSEDLAGAVERARAEEPRAPLLRGDELGLPPGPEIGRLLELIAEERAAGTIRTREQALALVRRQARS